MKILNLRWGIQSFTLAAMAALGELEPIDAAIHADTTHERNATYIVATCTLVRIVRIYPDNTPPTPEFYYGDYTPGRWAWYLSDVKPLAVPVPARGSLGLWEVNL